MAYTDLEKRKKCSQRYYSKNTTALIGKAKTYYSENRDSLIQYGKNYRIKNKAKISQTNLFFRQRHVFRNLTRIANAAAKKRGNFNRITHMDLYRLAKKQKCRCALTGQKLDRDNLSVDHILSISRGGTNVPENIRLVTFEVNIARNCLSDSEFLDLCRKVVDYHKS